MTFLVSYKLFKEYLPGITTIMIEVPQYCTEVEGTSAQLLATDVLSLHELFYALLLPRGNDAALVLADYFGQMVDKDFKSFLPKSNQFHNNSNIRHFIREMNVMASKLGLSNTYFDSPHSLQNQQSHSTALDVAILMNKCIQNSLFVEVIGKKYIEINSEFGHYEWQNTNYELSFGSQQLESRLDDRLCSITGMTQSAGCCSTMYFCRGL